MNESVAATRIAPPIAPAPLVRVRIERLVVSGVDVRDRAALATAVQGELTRLLTAREWSGTQALALGHVDAGSFRQGARVRETEFGARIAAAIDGGLPR